jgi:hypothetical protein
VTWNAVPEPMVEYVDPDFFENELVTGAETAAEDASV